MIIGTVRPEEAKVFDSAAGYHSFLDEDDNEYGSFEVFWQEPSWASDGSGEEVPAGWYWWACFPPDGEPMGPFASSMQARDNARDE